MDKISVGGEEFQRAGTEKMRSEAVHSGSGVAGGVLGCP